LFQASPSNNFLVRHSLKLSLKILLLSLFRRHWCDGDGLVERVRRGQLPLHVDGHVHADRDIIGRRSHREEVAPEHGDGRHQEETRRSC